MTVLSSIAGGALAALIIGLGVIGVLVVTAPTSRD